MACSARVESILTLPCSACVLCVLTACLQCNPKHQCYTCEPDGTCTPVKHHQRLMVSQHGALKGPHQMKAEIYARGPISCGIMATEGLDAYTGVWVWWSVCCMCMCVHACVIHPACMRAEDSRSFLHLCVQLTVLLWC